MAMQGVHQCRLLESLVVVIGGVASQNGHQIRAEGLQWTIFLALGGSRLPVAPGVFISKLTSENCVVSTPHICAIILI
jgi:hypothetical protein